MNHVYVALILIGISMLMIDHAITHRHQNELTQCILSHVMAVIYLIIGVWCIFV